MQKNDSFLQLKHKIWKKQQAEDIKTWPCIKQPKKCPDVLEETEIFSGKWTVFWSFGTDADK